MKSLLLFPALLLFVQSLQAQLQLVPTFASCGIYYKANRSPSCVITYKEKNSGQWLPAAKPVYDTLRKEYRVSLLRLKENTSYMVSVETMINGGIHHTEDAFTTLRSDVPVTKTINISTCCKDDKYALLKGIHGTPDGWIRVRGDMPVDAGTEKIYALLVHDCHYVIIEGITVRGGAKNGIVVDGQSDNIRIINCDIAAWGRVPDRQNEKGSFTDSENNIINNDAGIRLEFPENVLVERCYIHDPNGYTNAWDGVIQLGPFKGQPYTFTHPVGPNGIFIAHGRQGVVIRYNDITGNQVHRYNDPLETSPNGDTDGGFNKDADIYGNLFAFGQDDGIELDGGQCNVRMFDNRIEQTMTGMSTAPNKKGPSYIFNNLFWNLGNSLGKSTVGIKNGGGTTHSIGMQFLFNNTILASSGIMAGVGYGNDTNRALFHGYTRNNIFLLVNSPGHSHIKENSCTVCDHSPSPQNDFDYDMTGNMAAPDGAGRVVAAPGQEQHGVFATPAFTNSQDGIFTLQPTDKGIDKGVVLPGLTGPYTGAAPDLGAFELGQGNLTPVRPVSMEADKYFLSVEPGTTATINIHTGNIGGIQAYQIYKSADMDWLVTDTPSGSITDNTTLQVQVRANQAAGVQKGVMLFRLNNGFSIPFTVFLSNDVIKTNP